MIELGKKQTLYIVKKTPLGLFINEDPEELLNSLVLTKQVLKDVEKEYELGDTIEVYCYVDLNKKLIATLTPPIVCNGEIGLLKVVESNRYGAFLNWGYDKDVLLPFSEQLYEVKVGNSVMVAIYEDKSGRLCATQKVKNTLLLESPYKINDQVMGIIYDMKPDMGAFVAIDYKYFGLILSNEIMPNMKVGQIVEGRITKVREDGKLNMTIQQLVHIQMDSDSSRIYNLLCDNGGYLPYYDKTDKDTINQVFNMSKGAFKRGIGKLYKEHKIKLEDKGIRKIDNEEIVETK